LDLIPIDKLRELRIYALFENQEALDEETTDLELWIEEHMPIKDIIPFHNQKKGDQQMTESKKLELNWPDDVSYDNKTNWESTIIQNKVIAFVSFHYDQSAINPCEEWDGFGEIRSLSHRHINSITQEEIESMLESKEKHIVPLSYFEHGNCRWGVMGTMHSMPDFNWDGVAFAGIWIPDKECDATVDHYEKQAKEKGIEFNRDDKYKEMAEQACETYTAYCNGEVYGFIVELYRLQLDDDGEPIEDYYDYEHMDQLYEDSCWGFYGNDIDHMKDTITDSVHCHLKTMNSNSIFNNMSQDDFDRILQVIVKRDASILLTIPGLYEVVSEHYNNEVLDEWKKEQLNYE
jgi:hypothetical protein